MSVGVPQNIYSYLDSANRIILSMQGVFPFMDTALQCIYILFIVFTIHILDILFTKFWSHLPFVHNPKTLRETGKR